MQRTGANRASRSERGRSAAYPVLERAVALRPSRLRAVEPDDGSTHDSVQVG